MTELIMSLKWSNQQEQFKMVERANKLIRKMMEANIEYEVIQMKSGVKIKTQWRKRKNEGSSI